MPSVNVSGCVLDCTLTELTAPWLRDGATVVLHHGLGACQDQLDGMADPTGPA